MALPREIFFMQDQQRVDLPDPDPEMDLDDVRKMYAPMYGFLNNAVIHFHDHSPEEGQRVEYTQKQTGSKAQGGGKGQKVEYKHSAGTKG